jgi:2,3-dihydro-2,3-dihydroxybenzoate dehydrogenase
MITMQWGERVIVTGAAGYRSGDRRRLAEHGTPWVVVHAAGSMIGGSALDTTAQEWQQCVARHITMCDLRVDGGAMLDM